MSIKKILLLTILLAPQWYEIRAELDITYTEIAPGVFSSNFEGYGANHTFIVFDDYVVVFDPGSIEQSLAMQNAIKARTKLPVRYAIISHFHPDHAFGAPVFAQDGATIIAAASGKRDYEIWGKNQFYLRKKHGLVEYQDLDFPEITYIDHNLEFEDGKQRVEIKHYGHGHTKGDLVAWIPRHGILLVSDLANNGANNLANADIPGWLKILRNLQNLPAVIVVPGHGARGDKEILEKTHAIIKEMLWQTKKMIWRGESFKTIFKEINVPEHVEWTGKPANYSRKNIKMLYNWVTWTLSPHDKAWMWVHKQAAYITTSSPLLLAFAEMGSFQYNTSDK